MKEELKYKVGDKVLIEAEVCTVDTGDEIKLPYQLETGYRGIGWYTEEDIQKHNHTNLPPKPKVTQAVMDWYENSGKELDFDLFDLFTDFNKGHYIPSVVYNWLTDGESVKDNQQRQYALATLLTQGPEAVEVEKEKKYRVFIKGTSVYGDRQKLHYDKGNAFFATIDVIDSQDMFSKQKLDDIGFEGVFDNPMFEVEEVG